MIQVPVTGLNIPENGAATCYGTKPFGLDTCIDNTADSCTWVFPTPTCTEPPNDGSGSTPTLFPSSSPSLETTSDPCGDLFEFESTFLALLTAVLQFPPEMDENWVRYGLAKLGQISRTKLAEDAVLCVHNTASALNR